jgi:predicted enzyme related to lactoylglutathione lyase
MRRDLLRRTVNLPCGVFGLLAVSMGGMARGAEATPDFAVGAQYDTAHVYIAPEDMDRFAASFVATFDGQSGPAAMTTVTPTPSSTLSQLLRTPVGVVSAFGYTTPIPYGFGTERTGYMVTDLDAAVVAARAAGAEVVVAPFADQIGRDAIVQWPGGIAMQLYWHTASSSAPPLRTVPENRVYVSADRADAFVQGFLTFSHGALVSDDARAPGIEIGRPGDTYRRIRIESRFGKMTVLATDGHLPYPYGRETTGYEVSDLAATIAKAEAAGAVILVAPFAVDGRVSAMVRFPGGYVAELHAPPSG